LINTAIFAPAAVIGVWDHSIKSLMLQLKKSDHNVSLIRCQGFYSNICIAMPAFGVTENSSRLLKSEICTDCMKSQKLSDYRFPAMVQHLENYSTESDLSAIDTIMETINIDNWYEFSVNGIRIGQIASYEFLLNYKLKSIKISKHNWGNLEMHIRNVLKTYYAAINYFRENLVDNFIVYNRFYSINNIFCQVAEKNNINVFSIQNEGPASDVNSRFHLFSKIDNQLWLSKSTQWKMARSRPLGFIKLNRVNRHLKYVLGVKGLLTYSTNPDPLLSKHEIFAKLKLQSPNKVILIPTSSADERFALEILDFLPAEKVDKYDSLQILKEVVELAPSYPDYGFIFRIHPREFPNKRENVQSQHGSDLLDFISGTTLPKNLKINTPEDSLSIANLALVSDFILNSTSSVGLDFAALGLKVFMFSPTKNYFYPNELNFIQPDLKSCLSSISSLEENFAFPKDKQVLAYRWLYFKYFSTNRVVENLDRDFIQRISSILNRVLSPKFSKIVCNILSKFSERFFLLRQSRDLEELVDREPLDRFMHIFLVQKVISHFYKIVAFVESFMIRVLSKKLRERLAPPLYSKTDRGFR